MMSVSGVKVGTNSQRMPDFLILTVHTNLYVYKLIEAILCSLF